MPIGRAPTSVVVARALAGGTRRLAGAGKRVSRTAEDIHEIREHLEQANRQSSIEVLLNGLTHRRGAHRAPSTKADAARRLDGSASGHGWPRHG